MRNFLTMIENKDARALEYGVTAVLIAAAAIWTMIAVAPDITMMI